MGTFNVRVIGLVWSVIQASSPTYAHKNSLKIGEFFLRAKLVVKSHLTLAFTERKKQPTPVKEIERKDEEEWSLKDVVFVEDSKTLPVGKVIKVTNFFG